MSFVSSVVDCTVLGFPHELDLLEIRLIELQGIINLAVVAEGTHTYSGLPRTPVLTSKAGLAFIKRFPIVCPVMVDMPHETPHPGTRQMYTVEHIQRDAVLQPLVWHNPRFTVVLMSDIDEIPRREAVEDALERIRASHDDDVFRAYTLMQDCYYMTMNWFAPAFSPWAGTRIGKLELMRRVTPQTFRNSRYTQIDNGGWHFSFLGGADVQAEKVRSWSHIEWNRFPMNDPVHHAQCRREGRDWDITRNAPLVYRELDESYPLAVRQSPERYAEHFVERPVA